ncbi:MAG: phosphate ABC transporter substrate-binding/OmpA family protein [Calothrix sp. MO_192.B10]|nr:phosphate ABC transporter substrate-binding/OmpA family protein [Calothrix sp. MO_192.B10]
MSWKAWSDHPKIVILSLFLTTVATIPVFYEIYDRHKEQLSKVGNPNKEWVMLGNPFSGFSTFRNPEFKKALENEGISLEFKHESNNEKRARLLDNGEAQLIVTSLDQVIQHKPKGKIVGLIDRTTGADAVVVNTVKYPSLKSLKYPSLESLEALRKLAKKEHSKGRKLKIAFTKNNPLEFLVHFLDYKFDKEFELTDFEILEQESIKETWKSLKNDPNVVLAVLFEPFITQARKAGYKVLLSTENTPKAIIDVLVVSKPLLKKQPKKVSKFLEVYYAHINKYLLKPSLMKKQISKDDTELSFQEAENVYKGIHFFTALEANNWLTKGALEDQIKDFGKLLRFSGKIQKDPKKPKEFFTASPIQKTVAIHKSDCKIMEKWEQFRRICKFKPVEEIVGIGIPRTPPITLPSKPITEFDLSSNKITVYFTFSGSSTLTDQNKKNLQQLANKIQQTSSENMVVRVIGHASRTGGKDYNDFLSWQRAHAVEKYLENLGLKNQIIPEGKGYSSLIPEIPKDDPRQQRAEIHLTQINQ